MSRPSRTVPATCVAEGAALLAEVEEASTLIELDASAEVEDDVGSAENVLEADDGGAEFLFDRDVDRLIASPDDE